MPPTLQERLLDQPYQGYAYAYPHKMAYRHFPEPIPLPEVWANEDKSSLYLYVHLPFCEMRCGFCNLFTTTNPKDGLVSRYLAAVERQLEVSADALGSDFRFARAAFGGGTPSFLSAPELDQLFISIDQHFGTMPASMPTSFELSPATVTREKLALLKSRGITRLSIGVQSFLHEETRALGRPQSIPQVHETLTMMREANFPVMNIDLIYGAEIQTTESWMESIREALKYNPEELYLYPLYVRPLTGLEKIGRTPADHRLELFRAGRDFLREHGYRQISMRLFRRDDAPVENDALEGPVYCCQEDGMVGIGAGARSYTENIHYCTEYAVGRNGIQEIIDDYIGRSHEDHAHAVYGCQLSEQEQRRRFIMKSLLRIGGLVFSDYSAQFRGNALDDFPELNELESTGLATFSESRIELNDAGFERSDTIGPWLFSTEMSSRMERYELV